MPKEPISDETRQQVALQCRAIAHMARELANIHTDYSDMCARGMLDDIVPLVGPRTAAFMEKLGDMMNAIDAVTDEDAWVTPVFKKAHEMWGRQP